jgi:hypothetical protein
MSVMSSAMGGKAGVGGHRLMTVDHPRRHLKGHFAGSTISPSNFRTRHAV